MANGISKTKPAEQIAGTFGGLAGGAVKAGKSRTSRLDEIESEATKVMPETEEEVMAPAPIRRRKNTWPY